MQPGVFGMTSHTAGHEAPVHPRATAPVPRVQSDIPPPRRSFGNTNASASVNGTHAGAPNSSSDAGPKTGHDKGLGLSLNETIQRVQVSWEASRASRDSVVNDVYAEMQRMKSLKGPSANGHLGKRASMGAFEDTKERKRRAVEGEPHDRRASAKWGSSMGTNGRDLGVSGSGTSPTTAAAVNGTSSADKPRDGAQVLRAVRSAPNKALSPTVRTESKDAGLRVLEKAASKRHYKIFIDDEGKMMPTLGAIIPDGYKHHCSEDRPWVCPIRSCRKLFRNMGALGSHFNAGHRYCNLNDNSDGTLSIVSQFKAVTGPTTARVVSQKPLDLNEPPMPAPKPPGYVRPLTTDNAESRPAAEEPASTATAASGRTPRVIPPTANPLARTSSSPSSPTPAALYPDMLGGKLMPYLRAVLPEDFEFGLLTLCKEAPLLLQLPVKRELTSEWITRATGLKSRNPRCLLGMLLYLTGAPAEQPCPTCVAPEAPEECIVVGPSFPQSIVESFGGSCASCFYRYAHWHQKNQCLLRTESAGTPGAANRGSSFSDEAAVEDQLNDEAAMEGSADPKPEPEMANGTAGHESRRGPDPSRSPVRMAMPNTLARQEPRPAANGALVSQGNLISADLLEMEDWEVAPGTIRTTADEPENIAYSNAYLFSNAAVPIDPGVGFNVITLKPGGSHKFAAGESLRLCSLATGKLSVKSTGGTGGDTDFRIGPNGMFKVPPRTGCVVRNRVYVDAVLHVTTVDA